MYTCANCGGNLRFDIASQQLLCTHCSNQTDPYAVEEAQDAERKLYYDTMVYICPQCGARLLSEDTEAVAFCSYCGGTSMLSGKLTQAGRPQYIIPFSKTKEECKNAFGKRMKWAIYAPKELKNPEHMDGFRGIYMPYWYYSYEQKGQLHIEGLKSQQVDDYLDTQYYDLRGEIDASYEGIYFDASSGFLDVMSQGIAPYNLSEMKEFTPAFLSGFYADVADVPVKVYREEARNIAVADIVKHIEKESVYKGYLKEGLKDTVADKTQCVQSNSVMFPVWFLSFRSGDRVMYTAVNGQTGKMMADIPVDIKKYLLGTLILAVPVFFLMNMLPVIEPVHFLLVIMILAFVTILLFHLEICKIYKKDTGLDDRGRLNRQTLENDDKKSDNRKQDEPQELENAIRPSTNGWTKYIWTALVIIGLIGGVIAYQLGMLDDIGRLLLETPVFILALLASVVVGGMAINKQQKLSIKKRFGLVAIWFAQIASIGVIWSHTPYDVYYYGAAWVTLVAVAITLIDLIKDYNVLASRKLPQFRRTGGDNNA